MRLIHNQYKIILELGSGGFGKTFIAEDTHRPSRRRCVIKQLCLHPELAKQGLYEVAKARFEKEAICLEDLGESIDGVPRMYAYFAEHGEFYLVQELIEGKTLRQKVSQEGPFTELWCKEFLASFLKILEKVHSKNIIHRDIKPDNIIIRDVDERPFLIDFGIIKEVVTSTFDRSIAFGTPGYAPLEQALGTPVFASDLYSLSATIISALTGKDINEMLDPLTGRIQWRRYAQNISLDFYLLLEKATERDYLRRYATAKEMLQTLYGMSNGRTSPLPEQEAVTEPEIVQPSTPTFRETEPVANISSSPITDNKNTIKHDRESVRVPFPLGSAAQDQYYLWQKYDSIDSWASAALGLGILGIIFFGIIVEPIVLIIAVIVKYRLNSNPDLKSFKGPAKWKSTVAILIALLGLTIWLMLLMYWRK